MIALLCSTNDEARRFPQRRGEIATVSVAGVVHYGAGRGLSPVAVYATAAAREHNLYEQALAELRIASLATLDPEAEQLVHDDLERVL